MNSSKMKNMVVLKDLPSNIIDEAIIVLKSNVKIREKNVIESSETKANGEMYEEDRSAYVLKEAECVIKDYINKIESSSKSGINKNLNIKYRNWKLCSLIMGMMVIALLLINIF